MFAINSSWEGHSKALVEAMACGISGLCIDDIGIRNIIENGKNGYPVKASHVSLVNGISELFKIMCCAVIYPRVPGNIIR